MKWIILLLWNPVEALDLIGPNGKVAYAKVGGLFSFLALYALAWYEVLHRADGSLDWVKWTILWASIFGILGLRTWFSSKVAQRKEAFTRPPTEPDMYTDDERDE